MSGDLLATIVTHSLEVIMIFFLVLNSLHATLLLLAIPELWSQWRMPDAQYVNALIGREAFSPVSVVTAAHDEEDTIVQRIMALLAFDYPKHEVIVVNEGSKDRTMERLREAFDLYEIPPAFTTRLPTQRVRGYYRSRSVPQLLCIDKEHHCVSDALNAGINAVRYPYTLIVDSNTWLESSALLWLMRPFLLRREVVASLPAMGVANGGMMVDGQFEPVVPRTLPLGLTVARLLRTFIFERLGWNQLGGSMAYPVTAGLFRHSHLQDIGGFSVQSASPAMEITIRLSRWLSDRGLSAEYPMVPNAIAWRTLPEAAGELLETSARWQREGIHILREHRSVVGNPEYGLLGVISLPFVWVTSLAAPLLELVGYIALIIGGVTGVLSASLGWAYLAAVLGYGMLLSVWAVILEGLTFRRYVHCRATVRLVVYAVLQSFGHRQLLMWIHIRALFADRSLRQPYGQHFTSQAS